MDAFASHCDYKHYDKLRMLLKTLKQHYTEYTIPKANIICHYLFLNKSLLQAIILFTNIKQVVGTFHEIHHDSVSYINIIIKIQNDSKQ